MSEEQFYRVKNAVLAHVQTTFEEIEESMAMMHQEKYSLLEDACENANDVDELRIAFEQWHRDHSEELVLEESVDDLWDGALALMEEENEDDYIDDEDEENMD